MVNWKKSIIIVMDVIIGIYVVLAMTAFNKPDESENICTDLHINIEEDVVDGFLTTDEVKSVLRRSGINPVSKPMAYINTRQIEETLQGNDLVDQAECYKTPNGYLCINIQQRVPIIRVMNDQGQDYYVDSHGEPLQPNRYTCNLLVATGHVSKAYATKVLTPMANLIIRDKFWKNQIVQLNILNDGSVEIVPRVGNHIAYLGQPVGISKKLDRLRKFYRYGLSQAGWNKYSRISVEFDNQIICKRRPKTKS